jgi:Pentapeptide repeats (8 copies)
MRFESTDDLKGAESVDVDLSGARFQNVNLTGARVTEAMLVNARFSGLIHGLVSPVTFGQGAGQTTTGTATDIAGNSSSATVGPVNVDLTKPTITATASGILHNGVYSGSVTIHFTCTDALSGIVPTTGCPADRVVSSGGTTTVTGTATDRAGNIATTSISVTVKRVCEQEQDTLIDIGSQLAPRRRAKRSQPRAHRRGAAVLRDGRCASWERSAPWVRGRGGRW